MPIYTETQRPRQWWLLPIFGALALLGWGLFIQQIVRGKPVGSDPMPDWIAVLMAALLGIGMPLLFIWFRMTTTVYPDRVEIRMTPLVRRVLLPTQLAEATARTYRPLREFGGWGMRWGIHGFSANRAYNIRGDQGVQLVLTNGNRILIGTQHPQELERAIRSIMPQ